MGNEPSLPPGPEPFRRYTGTYSEFVLKDHFATKIYGEYVVYQQLKPSEMAIVHRVDWEDHFYIAEGRFVLVKHKLMRIKEAHKLWCGLYTILLEPFTGSVEFEGPPHDGVVEELAEFPMYHCQQVRPNRTHLVRIEGNGPFKASYQEHSAIRRFFYARPNREVPGGCLFFDGEVLRESLWVHEVGKGWWVCEYYDNRDHKPFEWRPSLI